MFKFDMSDMRAKLDAFDRSQGIIEFAMDGTILEANRNFLDAMGYKLEEVRGKHHSIFVDPAEIDGAEYRAFWDALRRGEFQAKEYRRLGKGGREVWIQASYNPVLGRDGRPRKVVKLATDITAQRNIAADHKGQIDAINRSAAVIHFDLSGNVLTANQNFLDAMGYRMEEIAGKHHSIFVDPKERESAAYRTFWEALRRGEYSTGEYRRIGKGGREVWIQASYNPIMDATGRPAKVMKFATDITGQVQDRMRRSTMQQEIDGDLGHIAQALEQTEREVNNAAEASERTSDTVQAVAASAEELVA